MTSRGGLGRGRPRWGAIVVLGLATVLLIGLGWKWFVGETTWPPELDSGPSATLFQNAANPTSDDLALLAELVGVIAQNDPVVMDLLDGKTWPDPDIRPVIWVGDGGRSALIGGTFQLDLAGADYFGPWPSAGCDGTKYRGTVRDVRALALGSVDVTIDLNFERVTNLVSPPQPVPPSGGGSDVSEPSLNFIGEFPDEPWYTGTCKRSLGPN